jgi:hypothetical protein
VASSSFAFEEHDASALPLAIATVEHKMISRTVEFWAFAQQVDTTIKANSSAQVVPSAKAIAEEVLRQHEQTHTEHRGTCVFWELWKKHRNEADMVRNFGLDYRDGDEIKREMYCPLC